MAGTNTSVFNNMVITSENIQVDKLNDEVWATLGPSEIHGIGVFAIRDIPVGTKINKGQEYRQAIGLLRSSLDLILEPIKNIIIDRHMFYAGDTVLIFRHPNSITRLQCFMNHSDDPNTDGETTLRDIAAGEEITENFLMGNREVSELTLKRMPFLHGANK